MKEVKNQLQTKIFELLTDAGLSVYDVAPVDAEYPFVEVGETSENENVDKDNYGQDVTFTFHIRDRFQGSAGSRANLYDIADKLKQALRVRPGEFMTLDDFYVTRQTLESEDFTKVADDTYLYFNLHTRLTFTTHEN